MTKRHPSDNWRQRPKYDRESEPTTPEQHRLAQSEFARSLQESREPGGSIETKLAAQPGSSSGEPCTRTYSPPISSSIALISGWSCKTTFSNELWTSIFPLYSIKPNLRNLFMKKLTRDRVVPIISASVS